MNEHRLSARLYAIARYIPSGSRMADIGTDHAYLPAHLRLQNKICSAVCGEINPGPLRSARELVERLRLTEDVDVRQGNGLDVLQPDEVDVVVIAGMGGALICNILENGTEKLASVHRLILQPNVASHLVRTWLVENGWCLVAEEMVEEGGRKYEILVAVRGYADKPYAGMREEERRKALWMGPYLMREQSAAFSSFWETEREKPPKNLQAKDQASSEHEQKRKEVEKELNWIEEVLSS
jgi:tRNA (adenine22-N1)-methyltransferase